MIINANALHIPLALVEPCIKAGTSERGVCPKCGKGWARVVETSYIKGGNGGPSGKIGTSSGMTQSMPERKTRHDITLGWQPACDCCQICDSYNRLHGEQPCKPYDPIPALVFDPFVGSGTTVKVAYDLGRRGVGLDLSLKYLDEQATTRIHNGHVGRLV